ncbi:choline kinase, cytoplasm [Desarmillaria tabescens]|uniref:Choline kinase, cytoplasm n=1 Tax=Armillaria tabescens TaxID=1929756 RepID=A0AA39NGZ8_ARMTA|nr:choline kinase, cytoplasm [Desarmillaria tabescens]KAK0465293.1 choline kinase, cytoplasm [Desarmillaria tabescens]
MPNYSPVISPALSTSSSTPSLIKRLSARSVQSLAELIVGSSSSSIQLAPEETQVVTEEGLRHADITLEARHYKTEKFAIQLLACIKTLHVPSWSDPAITPQGIKIQKVSGSMTNAVFFVSYPRSPEIRTLLLRIYGPSSGSLISRPRELHTLHILSSKYHLGPKVYGTFENGRLEEFFESTTLSSTDMRDRTISAWIGARMAELHSVDIEVVEETSPENRGEGKGWDLSVKVNVKSWLPLAQAVLTLPNVPESLRNEIDLERFSKEWKAYLKWLSAVDDVENGSRRVFAHNDAQYGNLLRLTNVPGESAPHRQIIVVDFEYAGPNPASFDIANHFQEWTADYHGPTPHLLDPSRYPSEEEQANFCASYIQHSVPTPLGKSELKAAVKRLKDQVRYWSPASAAMWAVWGIVQAREDVEGNVAEPEFDYLGYALDRFNGFRREIRKLGVTAP